MLAMNVNCKHQPFTQEMLENLKTIETRTHNVFGFLIGQRVGIVMTGKGKARLVGFATIDSMKVYRTEEEFRADEDKHLVRKGSEYDWHKVKYGYILKDVVAVKPRILSGSYEGSRSYRKIPN